MLAGGLVLLALGRGMTQSQDAHEAGTSPFGLVLQGLGLALMTSALWRLVKGV